MTYSIVGGDVKTAQVGGAGTSCLTGSDVYVIYRGAPGHGVIHAQAYYRLSARDWGAQLLDSGVSPADVLHALTDPGYEPNAAIRQYGIVDAQGRSAGYTGNGTTAFAQDRQGHAGDFAYSVQGNILTSAKVLDQAAAAFESGGCDLAERLMLALEAGAQNGEGDNRCTPQGIPSDSAFLQVEEPGTPEGAFLSVRVETSGTQNPLPLLRAQLDAWRLEHPCPRASTQVAPSEPSGCACNLAVAECDSALLVPLLCGWLVVARRRQRAAR